METFLVGLLYWCLIGFVLTLVHFHVYFRGIDNALDNYRTIDNETKEMIDLLREMDTPITAAICLYLFGMLLGPIKFITIASDVYRFSIKKK